LKITVKVKPNSRENSVKETGLNTYEIKVSVPPEKGKANDKVIELLAKFLNIPKSAINLRSGSTSRNKIFEIR
jgi:uncharacterized protein